MTSQQDKKSFLTLVREYWFLLVFASSILITWTNFINVDAQTGVRLTKVEENITKAQDVNNQTLQTLTELKTDISWIKTRLK